jgi:hypothetical protein
MNKGMSDAELSLMVDSIVEKSRNSCRLLFELVDLWGQDRAFIAFQAEHVYPRQFMVRMIHAGANGATEDELFAIASEIEKLNRC